MFASYWAHRQVVVEGLAVGRDLAADQTAAEIHSELDSETVAVASAELFVTVAEIVVVAGAVIDEWVVDGMTDELVAGEVADAGCVVDVVTDAVAVDAGGAMSDVVFDEQDIQKGPAALGVRSFRLAMSVADHYLVDTFASRQTVCLSADCFGHKYCHRSRRKC